MIAATATAVIWVFNTFASAADVERIHYRLLKADIREIRRELQHLPPEAEEAKRILLDELEEVIDELCELRPDDRECKKE